MTDTERLKRLRCLALALSDEFQGTRIELLTLIGTALG